MHKHGQESIWGLERHLTWPGIRGKKLFDLFTVSPTSRDQLRYEIEQCVPTPGHIAFVLLKKRNITGPIDRQGSLKNISPYRVLYVIDAIPPQKPTMLKPPPVKLFNGVQNNVGENDLSPTNIDLTDDTSTVPDELQLIDELFTTSASTTTTNNLITKPPIICARFDHKIVGIQFVRTKTSISDSSLSTQNSTTTVRCVVAREDGEVFIWSWCADLHQWTFLNHFCFLENVNLKWTKPVAAFSVVSDIQNGMRKENSGFAEDIVEFIWWSKENKDDPKLFSRCIRFETELGTAQRVVQVGSPLLLPLSIKNNHSADVEAPVLENVKLLTSTNGVWIVSFTSGILLRVPQHKRGYQTSLSISWDEIFLQSDIEANNVQFLQCAVHDITGELIILCPWDGLIVVLKSVEEKNNHKKLIWKSLSRLNFPAALCGSEPVSNVESIKCYRHLIMIQTKAPNAALYCFSLKEGLHMHTFTLPHSISDSVNTTSEEFRFWNYPGAVSSVGLWSTHGFWRIKTPTSAILNKTINSRYALSHSLHCSDPDLATIKDTSILRCPACKVALNGFSIIASDSTEKDWIFTHNNDAAHHCSSPALLLASATTVQPNFNSAQKEQLVAEKMVDLVTKMYDLAETIGSNRPLNQAQTQNLRMLTPANLEALPLLARWTTLAGQKTQLENGSLVAKEYKCSENLILPLQEKINTQHQGPNNFKPLQLALLNTHEDEEISENSRIQTWLMELEEHLNISPKTIPNAKIFQANGNVLYFEAISRLYLLVKPAKLKEFLKYITPYFTYTGVNVARRPEERMLTLLPPMCWLYSLYDGSTVYLKEKDHVKKVLLAYTDLLFASNFYVEGCRVLLDAKLYEECKRKFQAFSSSHQVKDDGLLATIYFALLGYCVKNLGQTDLTDLIRLKPSQVHVVHVLQTIRTFLPQMTELSSESMASGARGRPKLTIGTVRPAILNLLQTNQGSLTLS